uniref:Uncharacterized protein n=1 Tax=Nelumbo nucifera TaxID=4432 RepID=A0A822Z822_NELNU|nr:TPA_asm: hypothetical protein HUJ06_013852 [Nelumbo nucifera]
MTLKEVGPVVKLDCDTEKMKRTIYPRVCVKVDLTSPFILKIPVTQGGIQSHIKVFYKNIFDLCINCEATNILSVPSLEGIDETKDLEGGRKNNGDLVNIANEEGEENTDDKIDNDEETTNGWFNPNQEEGEALLNNQLADGMMNSKELDEEIAKIEKDNMGPDDNPGGHANT